MGEFWWQQVEFAIFGFEEQFWSRTAMSCGECKVSMISEDGEDEKTVKRKTAKFCFSKKSDEKPMWTGLLICFYQVSSFPQSVA